MSYSTTRGTVVGTLKGVEDGAAFFRLSIAETFYDRQAGVEKEATPVHVYVSKNGQNAESHAKALDFLRKKDDTPVVFDFELKNVKGLGTIAVGRTKPDLAYVGLPKQKAPANDGGGFDAPTGGGFSADADEDVPFMPVELF